MPITVHRTLDNVGLLAGYNWSTHYCFEFAKALSESPDWEIIDSYHPAASTPRVKGDPFNGYLWGDVSYDNTSAFNLWFVAEQVNPEDGFPAMQIKGQGAGNTTFDDPSGNDYGYESTTRCFCIRFAPFGGWNLADTNPDFANPTKVSQNLYSPGYISNVWDGWWVTGPDFVLALGFAYNWDNMPCYIGRYLPMSEGQHTPEHPCYWYFGSDAYQQLKPDYEATSNRWFFNTNSYNPTYHYVICPDENGLMKVWEEMCPPLGEFFRGFNRFNEFDSVQGLDLIEVPVHGMQVSGNPLSPDWRHIGSHKNAWIGQGLGNRTFLGDKEYLAVGGPEHGVVIPWDGATDITL